MLHVTRLVATDLDAALAYTRKLPGLAQREACYEPIALELSRNQPLHALKSRRATSPLFAPQHDRPRRPQPERSARWAIDLESDVLRETVLRTIAPELASIDPAFASEIIDATIVGKARFQTLALILQQWEKHDPNAAKNMETPVSAVICHPNSIVPPCRP